MINDIKEVRKHLTTIELEVGQKHPDVPDVKLMIDSAAEAEQAIQKIMRQLEELL